jgi:hypothetical protein
VRGRAGQQRPGREEPAPKSTTRGDRSACGPVDETHIDQEYDGGRRTEAIGSASRTEKKPREDLKVMSSNSIPTPGTARGAPTHFVELWGDVVDTRHLAASVAISAVISVGTYLIAGRIFAPLAPTPALAKAYAMLAGLGGCVASGAICAKLFPPKRDVVDEAVDPHWRDEALAQLESETGTLGDFASLSPVTLAELKEVGLYETFVAAPAPAGHAKEV